MSSGKTSAMILILSVFAFDVGAAVEKGPDLISGT